MFRRAVIVFAACTFVVVFSCSDSDDTVTGPVDPTVTFADYVHFDSTQTLIAKVDYGRGIKRPEVFLWWEEFFGEPFLDVNENGTYDVGIDVFIVSTGDDNMDLNHDGRWTGPPLPWEPGLPFDDIDGNDTCREADYYYPGDSRPGVPFFDANGNGVLDSALDYVTFFARPVQATESDSGTTWLYANIDDTVLYFVSDSGAVYYLELPYHNFPVCYSSFGQGVLITDSAGLHYYSLNASLVYGSYNLFFDIVPDSPIRSRTERISFLSHTDLPSYCREISLDQALEINGVNYTGLVNVRCDQIQWSIPSVEEDLEGAFWEFYFSKDIGLAAVREKCSATSETWQCSFEILDEQVPILLRK